MADELVILATLASAANAHAARSRLAAEGIRAIVTDDVVVETLWHASPALGGVRLRVMTDDLARARTLLEEFENQESAASSPWRCGPCQQDIESGFEVCWSCSRPRDEVEDHTYVPTTSVQEKLVAEPDELQTFPADDLNPYRPSFQPTIMQPATVTTTLDVEDTVRRALRASVIGLVMCPVLVHFYSMWLLAAVSLSGQRLSRAALWRFFLALVINVVATLAFVLAFSAAV